MRDALRPVKVTMQTRFEGTIILNRDPLPDESRSISILPPDRLRHVEPEAPLRWSARAGYRIERDEVVFVFAPELYPHHDRAADPVLVAGPFNNWTPDASWRLSETREQRRPRLTLRVPLAALGAPARGSEQPPTDAIVGPGAVEPGDCDTFGARAPGSRGTPTAPIPFKFIAASGYWFQPPDTTPNLETTPEGCTNLVLHPGRSGNHVLRFALHSRTDQLTPPTLLWAGTGETFATKAAPGGAFFKLAPTLPLGVFVGETSTTFRLFAPRATSVRLETITPDGSATLLTPLSPACDGVWEASRPGNLHGWRYRYFVDGPNHDGSTDFNPNEPILDPYAAAAQSPAGPGFVIDEHLMPPVQPRFTPAPLADLVIAEAHLRDLLALDPEFAAHPRPGFRELAAFIRRADCPLRTLGVNALELLPVQEFDAPHPQARPSGFHWGYMPVNWFSPTSLYASDPAHASQIHEFRDLVAACHEAGIAVILDVVYNHTGEPNALLRLDKHLFFTDAPDGALSNWSGCGNDLRADTPMGTRLIIDSLRWLVEKYDVDGFRFDLAELLGAGVLHEIRREIAPLKPNLALIAEPWSFRGHIASELRGSGFASWNDGYRDFFAHWVWGARDADGLAHFLCGSPGSRAASPADTVNYTESHDDLCWLDRITENPGNDGTHPTPNDIRRTRLMFACLLASQGTPMFAAGQEFLRTKGGTGNTYLRGDLSRLTPERLADHAGTRQYVRDWITLRLSPAGSPLRHPRAHAPGYFKKFPSPDGRSLALLINADRSAPGPSLIFAANPNTHAGSLPCGAPEGATLRLLADDSEADPAGIAERTDGPRATRDSLELPPLSAALWEIQPR